MLNFLCVALYIVFLFRKLFGKLYVVCMRYVAHKENHDKILCFHALSYYEYHTRVCSIAEMERTFPFIRSPFFYCSFGLHFSFHSSETHKHKLNKGEADFPINETHAHGSQFNVQLRLDKRRRRFACRQLMNK